jgi:hypothetical protein
MQRDFAFATRITKNGTKTRNTITTTIALLITVTTLLLLSSQVVGVVNVWADNFFSTSGPDTIDGTDDADNSNNNY